MKASDKAAASSGTRLLPSVHHRELELTGGRLHFVEAGAKGEPLILVHGGHGSWTHWVANIEPLSRSRKVLALDLPGFGASFNPKPAYSIEQYAGVVSTLLDRLAIKRAAIAGFSFGSVVSAAAARAEPRRISHVVLTNPPGIGPASPIAADIQQSLSAKSVREGLRAGALGSLQRIQLFDQTLIDDAVVDLMIDNVRKTRFISRTLSRSSEMNGILSEVEQPLLVLIGREDLHRQFGLAEALRDVPRAAPQAQIFIVERARHWLQFDRAQLFNELLVDFLAGADTRKGSHGRTAG